MNNKYKINILSYNIYFKSMLGLDPDFLPTKVAHKNVKRTIRDSIKDNYIIGLQEVECEDKIFPSKIKSKNFIKGQSGNDKVITIWSDNFKLLKSKTFEFRDGRPIQISLFNFYEQKYLIMNIHAPHQFQSFGRYIGDLNINNEEFSKEIIRILNEKIRIFIKDLKYKIKRIIILGDFNEIFNFSSKNMFPINSFEIDLGYKIFTLKTDRNSVKTCCLPKIIYKSDYIFDSKREPTFNIANKSQPASDHYPIISFL
tara:strand:+ start:407 stop:1174 length:768 start_codon:yes stop_codon:yes gene_type:complete